MIEQLGYILNVILFQQVVISLQNIRGNASLSTVRFFVRENPSSTLQTPHYTSPSTAWIISEDEKTKDHHFNEVCILKRGPNEKES